VEYLIITKIETTKCMLKIPVLRSIGDVNTMVEVRAVAAADRNQKPVKVHTR